MMDVYFVRVYHMKDGSKEEPLSIFQDYKDAEDSLHNFYNLVDVDYATIEKRFSFNKIWN